MGLLQLCSGNSCSRGYDYYKEKRVLSFSKVDDEEFIGEIKGSGNNIYNVKINIDHPRKSSCNCPFADGTRKICKHMVALYFTCLPKEADKYKNYHKLEKRRYEQSLRIKDFENIKRKSEITRYVNTLSKEETTRLAARQQKFIQNLQAALVRIENKTYGICRETGKLIPAGRLRAVPHATLSIEAKQSGAK